MQLIDHWMMFGTFAEQRHFIYPSVASYAGAVINANMAAHAPDGLAAFLVEKTSGLAYIIDPMTHAWQHEPMFVCDAEGNPKKALSTLAQNYGEPYKSALGRRPLTPDDFRDQALHRESVERVITFQKNRLSLAMASTDAMRYLEATDKELRPRALVSPYFYLHEVNLQYWLPIMLQAVEYALPMADGIPVYGGVVIGKGLLQSEKLRKQLTTALLSASLDGYVVWVDGLQEQEASASELCALLELCRSLRINGSRYILNLHGGYFSVLAAGELGNNALNGVTHAPEFGEARSVVPIGGGIPIARYYVPELHSRVRYRDAQAMFKAKGWLDSASSFFQNVCDCEECRKVLKDSAENFILFGEGKVKEVKRGQGIARMEYPTPETKLRCLRHYLQRKQMEHDFVSRQPKEIQLQELTSSKDKYIDVLGFDGIKHLVIWKQVFEAN
ncbi:MAG: hypothetical protein QOJ65_1383 [Fimbriimonadaceae bacterium]|jgi:hypothetical protein|nr:hypothetical protein [Fimbriimonadaceae bacterium]